MTANETPLAGNLLTTFIDMIAAPAQAFRRISERQQRSWWLPAFLALVGPLLYLWLNVDRTVALAQRQLQLQLSTIPPDQAEAARSMAERFTQPRTVLLTGSIGTVLSLLILYFGSALFGAMPKAQTLWPAVVWSWLPFALRGFLQTGWSLANQALIQYQGLSYFVATGDVAADSQRPLFVALSQIDLFSLWHVVLVYVLLRVVVRLGSGGAFSLTLLYALLNIGLRVLPVFIRGLASLG